MLSTLPFILVVLSGFATAFPKETRTSACRRFPYETSVRSDDKGVSLRFKPSAAAVRQLLDVVAHFNVTCGDYFRYAEAHPMGWTGELYTTDLRKETLLQHCSEQSEYLGTLNNTVQVKVEADDAGKNFVTVFSRGLEPFTKYKLMLSDQRCDVDEKGTDEGAMMEVVSNEDGELYQVSQMKVPSEQPVIAKMVDPSGEMFACGELEPQMPDAFLSYAFNFTIEEEGGKKVQCNTHVFQADPSTLLEEDLPDFISQQMREPRMEQGSQPANSLPSAMPSVEPAPAPQMDNVQPTGPLPGTMRRRGQPGVPQPQEATGEVWSIPAFAEVTVSGEGQECNTAMGRVCNPGLICAKDATNPREEGVCQQSSLFFGNGDTQSQSGAQQQTSIQSSTDVRPSGRRNYAIPEDAIRPQVNQGYSDMPPAGFGFNTQPSQPQQRTQGQNFPAFGAWQTQYQQPQQPQQPRYQQTQQRRNMQWPQQQQQTQQSYNMPQQRARQQQQPMQQFGQVPNPPILRGPF